MNEREINALRKKFIVVSTIAFALVMFIMGGMIYGVMLRTIRVEVKFIMDYIIDNGGELPEADLKEGGLDAVGSDPADENDSHHHGTEDITLEERMKWELSDFFNGDSLLNNPDFVYTTRYFSVIFNEDGSVDDVKISHSASASEEAAEYYARIALDRLFKFGSFGSYYYQVEKMSDGKTIVIYLDRTSQVKLTMQMLFMTLGFIFIGSVLAFLIMRKLSGRIIRPEIENAERQKQFITNASHELKTPLAVIRANTEMQEMLGGETEWTQSNMRQVKRMEGLIQNLVMIARSQERENSGELTETDVSAAVNEAAMNFGSVAASEGKTLTMDVDPDIKMYADDSKVRQLVSLLTDNAVKYCDDGGDIGVSLKKNKSNIVLSVSNPYAEGSEEECKRFFERFYRSDASHNTEKGGYGIGLSVAEGLVKQMGGTIKAEFKEGVISFVCVFNTKIKR
ncbi:MAG: HAMP domain-containing histidine kinase [Lachnospiraceae bacterium]|nr:HAMP domain-containing histidine kinase [Lachnospiraceae bacterium]